MVVVRVIGRSGDGKAASGSRIKGGVVVSSAVYSEYAVKVG